MFNELFDKSKTTITLLGPKDFPEILLAGVQAPVVYVDGGTRWREKAPPEAGRGVAIGDGDSSQFSMDMLLPKAKSYSDLSYVFKNIPPHFTDIRAYGFLGDRRDHEIMNLGEAHHFLKNRERCMIRFDHEIWAFSAGEWSLYIDGVFSFVNLEACDVRIEGLCEYQIKEDKKVLPLTSLGLSNTGRGKVIFSSSLPFLIYPEKVLRVE
jgi:thiamine pyrophosphokinase